MSTPIYVGSTSFREPNGAVSAPLAVPSGTQVGDMLIVHCSTRIDEPGPLTQQIAGGSGAAWSSDHTGTGRKVFWRKAQAGDIGATISVSIVGGSSENGWVATCSSYRKVSTVSVVARREFEIVYNPPYGDANYGRSYWTVPGVALTAAQAAVHLIFASASSSGGSNWDQPRTYNQLSGVNFRYSATHGTAYTSAPVSNANHDVAVVDFIGAGHSGGFTFNSRAHDVDDTYGNWYENGGWGNRDAAVTTLLLTNSPPAVPGAFTSPASGAVVDQSHTITWGASTDPDGDAVYYNLELSTNGGGSWKRLVSGTSSTSYTYNFANEPQVSNAIVRVQANDGTSDSGWRNSANFSIVHQFSTPTAITPGNGATINTDIPTLGGTMASNGQPQKLEWQLATNTAFTANVRTITQPDSALKTSGTQSMVIPNASQLFQGVWYIRARGIGSGGSNASNWSATNTITVTHQPTTINHSPTGGVSIEYGTGVVTMSSTFSDTSPVDSMTAAQFVLERNDTGALINDSGKLARTGASASFTTSPVGVSLKDVVLRWMVRMWDSDDVAGPYSSYHLLKLSDLPVVTIVSPGEDSLVNNGQPTITWGVQATDGRTQASRRVFFTRTSDGVIVHDTGMQATADLSYSPPSVILQNVTEYTVTVQVTDSTGLIGEDSNVFSTMYDQPDRGPFTVDASRFDDLGYVRIHWDDYTKDVDWVRWAVYRKQTGIDVWEELAQRDYNPARTTLFTDDQTFTTSVGVFANNSGTTLKEYRTDLDAPYGAGAIGIAGTTTGLRSSRTGQRTVTPGTTISASAHFRAAPGLTRNCDVALRWMNEGNVIGTTSEYGELVTADDNGWVLATVSDVVVPDGVIGAHLVVRTHDSQPNEYMYISALTMREGSNPEFDDTPYEYFDYLACSGYEYEYAVAQVVSRFGAEIQSPLEPVAVTPISSHYWVIFGEEAMDSFKLDNVTGDNPTEEYEEETITLIGRGRHREYGTRFGWQGEINAQLFNSADRTARMKWLQLQEMKARLTSFYLRNPFGDLWLVSAGNITLSRMPGTARDEIGSVTIPYTEVS